MTRGERIGCIAAMALFLLMTITLVYVWRWEDAYLFVNPRHTVPEAVLYDSHAQSAQQSEQVRRWGVAEEEHLVKQGFTLPPHTITVVGVMEANGWTVISAEPTKYDITLVRYLRPNEDAVRKVLAHEVFHVIADMRGITQSEETADAFVVCFGSPKASAYARRWGRVSEPDCGAIGELLGAK